ncbi:hypothetical protein QDR37_12655 [Amnibacterium sp. CER49]|uniref:hypothetical protein n=1 Tax=Amnibacterium sp. CER49 TaxID=3039161 RepID=UPI0024495EF9|nr:hypothetical protein [Amnibacterium sp. CER49]MDH2444798.1 hypothetical protein [Amnibacterium sp. CER49]
MSDRVLQPQDHDDGTVTVTAAIRVRVRDPLDLRVRVALPHVNEDGEVFVGDDGARAALARAVSIVLDAAPFEALGIELVNNQVSAPGATAFHPHLPG